MKRSLPFVALLVASSAVAQLPTPVNICIVTVDNASTHNIIVWEKPPTANIDSVRIYRDGNYIDRVAWTDSSLYRDFGHDPNLGGATYYLQPTLGVQAGIPSAPHRTIHLTVTDLGGAVRCDWTHYIGLGLQGYECWLDSAGTGSWNWIFTGGWQDSTWNHNTPPQVLTNAWYFAVTDSISVSCNPSLLLDPGPEDILAQNYNSSRSNRANPAAQSSVGEFDYIKNIQLYPIPATEDIMLELSSKAWDKFNWQVIDVSGRTVLSSPHPYMRVLGKYTEQINVTNLKDGVYLLQLTTPYQTYSKRFVKH